ncbi:hypothetical protein GCM10009809_03030 [Isoptericola hypogeus]|uniref:Methyltransferase family protein n=1 Tax=Isoptericola hypogeus TaxID=300179 RepID=A0ABN2IRM8_9MICO
MTRRRAAKTVPTTLTRHELLVGLHQRLRPRTYLEIGVATGASLALSRVPSIGIDPAYQVVEELHAKVRLARAKSDDYFAAEDPKQWLGGPIDLAFIDGMHLFEFALRDFMNVEKHSRWSTVVVFDDMLPRDVDEAARGRHTKAWTGDVFWVAEVLRAYRPDLTVFPVDTRPTGVVVVTGLDPDSTVLEDAYDEILAKYVHDDPQPVPDAVLRRKGAWDARKLLNLPLWGCLHRGAWPLHTRAQGLREISEAIERPAEYRRRRRAVSERVRRLAGGVTQRPLSRAS